MGGLVRSLKAWNRCRDIAGYVQSKRSEERTEWLRMSLVGSCQRKQNIQPSFSFFPKEKHC